jgi:F-type H+-transporting ATPase subunit a
MSDPSKLIEHVQDARAIEFWFFGERKFEIWQPFGDSFPITKFMLAELLVAGLMVIVFAALARRIKNGESPRGRFVNMFESVLVFIRDEVARPSIGEHHADRFLPFLWTVFFFILFGNLLGMLPWLGTPNGALGTTIAYAAITFAVVVGAGMKTYGPIGFWIGQVPSVELPWYMAIVLKPMLFAIEVFGLCVKHCILAIRLFANMFAGHLVLAVLLGFIIQTAGTLIWYGVMPASLLGSLGLSLLELLVCFIQAYVFTFLAAIFIGMAVHQH